MHTVSLIAKCIDTFLRGYKTFMLIKERKKCYLNWKWQSGFYNSSFDFFTLLILFMRSNGYQCISQVDCLSFKPREKNYPTHDLGTRIGCDPYEASCEIFTRHKSLKKMATDNGKPWCGGLRSMYMDTTWTQGYAPGGFFTIIF